MRSVRLLSAALTLAILAGPALAQGTTSPYDVSWAALDPGNDWAAQVLRSLFPVNGGVTGMSTGAEATVIAQLVGQFTGFVGAIACAFVAYSLIINIHRAAETSRVLGTGQSWMFVVRVGFAGILMFPIGGGFSAGQAFVMQAAMTGVGMARAVYSNAIQAVGPDAVVVARPMVPGTKQIVTGLIESELCMDLVNLASNTLGSGGGPLVPLPPAITSRDGSGNGFLTYRYEMSANNGWGNPVCGSVQLALPAQTQTTVGGVAVDMAAVQAAILKDVLTGSIRNQVAQVAQQLWQTRRTSSLAPLQGILVNATNNYTAMLTSAATSVQSRINASVAANAGRHRRGQADLLPGQQAQDALGWTSAGAYYLEIAKLNATTLSLLQNTPTVTAPTYQGLSRNLSIDLAAPMAAVKDFMGTLNAVVQTTDTSAVTCGSPNTPGGDDQQGAGVMTKVFCSLHLSSWTLKQITDFLLPGAQVWSDPFGGLMSLGQTLINTALVAMGVAAVLSGTLTSTGTAVFEFLTLNWTAAAATVAGHAIMDFLGTPIFYGLLAILIPGIFIAYVLPMIPWVMWMAGVCGWIILVCEAMIAVPLWMLAHMTVGGDGLHGRASEGYSLLFNVVFRPTLMLLGLFLGYFVFSCMSWLIRQSFGLAAGFVLTNGWIVTNFLGLAVLISIFVMTHVAAALMSFRMVALLPHHLPRLIGFTSANRVDADEFQYRAAQRPGMALASETGGRMAQGLKNFSTRAPQLRGQRAKLIPAPGPESQSARGARTDMDPTLRAATDSSRTGDGRNGA